MRYLVLLATVARTRTWQTHTLALKSRPFKSATQHCGEVWNGG